jgi:trigger factor
MQITVTSTEGLTRELNVVIPADEMEKRLLARLAEVAKTVSLPGFRPGKVPTAVLKQRYGQAVMGEVVEDAVKQTSGAALQEQHLRPALRPQIEIISFEPGQDLTYLVKVEILPEIAAPDITLVELERLVPEIADEEVDQALTQLAERYRKSETLAEDVPAASGDSVVIDFVGSIDDVEFPGGSGTNHELELGSGSFIPGFEDQLIGAKTGDKVIVTVDFPADYAAAHLAGKTANFACTVNEIKRKLPAVIDENLAETVGMENLEALRTAVREQILGNHGKVARLKMKRDLLDRLSLDYDFEVPPGMVEIEFSSIWEQFEAERKRQQDAGTFEPEEGKTDDDYKAEYRDISVRRVRLGLLLAEIGKSNNIQVTHDEVNRAIMAEARRYPGQEKAVIDYYRANAEAVSALHAPIYEDKVVDFIFGMAKVTDKPVPAKDLAALAGLEDEDDEAAA